PVVGGRGPAGGDGGDRDLRLLEHEPPPLRVRPQPRPHGGDPGRAVHAADDRRARDRPIRDLLLLLVGDVPAGRGGVDGGVRALERRAVARTSRSRAGNAAGAPAPQPSRRGGVMLRGAVVAVLAIAPAAAVVPVAVRSAAGGPATVQPAAARVAHLGRPHGSPPHAAADAHIGAHGERHGHAPDAAPAPTGSALHPGPGAPYRTLQDAIYAARPGDTIRVPA